MKRTLKVGQIGIGHNHAAEKMETVRKFPDLFEVVGYAEENERWIEKRGTLKAYEGLMRLSVDEIIERSDVVLIESDVWNLTEYAQRCIDAGKHIHMDKPASGTLEEYKHLLDTAEAKGLVVQLGYMYRYNPAVQKCFEYVKEGKIGEIHSINAEMSTMHKPKYRSWLRNFGGGIMYILGSHLVDLIVFLMGEPQRITPFLRCSGFDGVEVEDNNLAVLEYENAIVRIFVSSIEVNGWGRRQFVVAGKNGTVNIMPMERDCHMTYSDTSIATRGGIDMKEIVDIPPVSADTRYDEMMQDFYAYVLGEKENPYTYQHDYLVQKVLSEIIGGVKVRGTNID